MIEKDTSPVGSARLGSARLGSARLGSARLGSARLKNDISIVSHVKKLYAILYQVGNKLPKREKLGIHKEIEKIGLEIISDIISATFAQKHKKIESLEKARISIEIAKHLVRTEHELKIIEEKTYIHIESLLIEISKMTNGWIKYITQNPPKAD